ncbi:MAG: hypothetical protein V3U80_00505 [Flavobacteriaceae bacterium]
MKIKKTSNILFIVLGLVIITILQIMSRKYNFSDITKGIINGLGYGFMIAGVINLFKVKSKQESTSKND